MGSFWRLIKLNISSVKKQEEVEEALKNRDGEKAKLIIGEYISSVLREGLSARKWKIFQKIWDADQETLKKRLVEAFRRGWDEAGVRKPTNFSDALRNTLLEAEKIIKENRDA